jgi:molybdopterin converting factor small subunit
MCQNLNITPPDPGDIPVSVHDGESVLGLVERLAVEQGGCWKTILREIGASILVVRNGSLVNPHDRPEALLRDGDELLFLPMFEGG